MKVIPKINEWLAKEKELGSLSPDRVVLATAGKDNIPHSRIVAIREVDERGLLFFTQRETRKVAEMQQNPHASMTLWLPLQQREIILEGRVVALSNEENDAYWKLLPHDRQLRFDAYAPTSAQPISSIDQVQKQYQVLAQQYNNHAIPMSKYYCGFRLVPHTYYFYTLGSENFSECLRYDFVNNEWNEQLLSP